MASESTSPADLSAIPSSVSGDGTTFVKGLKKYLEKYDRNVDNKISNIGEGSVNQVTSLRLTEEHRTNASGNINDIRVEFDTVNVSDYAFAQIWLRKGTSGAWIQQGNTSGVQYVIEDVKADSSNRYYVKVIACNSNAGYSDFDTAPVESILVSGSVLLCNTPTQFYWSNDDRKWHWGGYTDNGYTDFFEIRTDQNAGIWNEHRLDAIPAGTYYSTVMPTTRSGTAYLYVRNVFGQYNTPATHQYSVTAPQKPTKASLESTIDGVVITLQGLPSGCTNYIVTVGTEEFEVYTSQWTYYQFSGSISVKYCFVDSIGRGPDSDVVTANVGRLIEAPDLAVDSVTTSAIKDGAVTSAIIANGAVTADEIASGAVLSSALANNAVTSDKIAANAVVSSKIYSGAVISDKIAANAVIAGKIAADAVDANQIKANAISSAKIAADAITSEKIAANAITAGKIAANAVEAEKIKAGAITAAKIATGAITIGGSGREVSIADGAINGSKITVASIFGDKIAANTITANNLKVTSLAAISANLGTVTSGSISCSNGVTIGAGAVTINSNGIEVITQDGGVIGLTGKGFYIKDSTGKRLVWFTGGYFESPWFAMNKPSGLVEP